MQRPRHVGAIVLAAFVLALAGLSVAAASPPLSSAQASEAVTGASKSATTCGSVTTRTGRRAIYIAAARVGCKVARRVARRANGRAFRTAGFRCRVRKSGSLPGKLYGCRRTRGGVGQGVGFLYLRR